MSKRFMDFIRETRDEKATEKALISRAAMLVVVVVGCLAAMCLTAYAYFTCNITSDANTLQAAKFQAKVSIQLIENDQVIETIVPQKNGTWTYTASGLQVGKSYTVTVSYDQSNTASTGYVAVMAGGCKDIYHTQQLGADTTAPGGNRPELTFKLMITDGTAVAFEARWGTSAYYPNGTDAEEYIVDGEEIKMVVNNVTQVIADGEETPSDEVETTPPASEEVTPPTTAAATPNDTEADAPVEPDTTEPPATEPPATEPPATEPPATEPPATEPPTTEPPATEPPVTEDEVADSTGETTE